MQKHRRNYLPNLTVGTIFMYRYLPPAFLWNGTVPNSVRIGRYGTVPRYLLKNSSSTYISMITKEILYKRSAHGIAEIVPVCDCHSAHQLLVRREQDEVWAHNSSSSSSVLLDSLECRLPGDEDGRRMRLNDEAIIQMLNCEGAVIQVGSYLREHPIFTVPVRYLPLLRSRYRRYVAYLPYDTV